MEFLEKLSQTTGQHQRSSLIDEMHAARWSVQLGEVLIPEEVESVKTIWGTPRPPWKSCSSWPKPTRRRNWRRSPDSETERQRYQELFEFAPDATQWPMQWFRKLTALLPCCSGSAAVLVGKPLFVFVAEQERQCFHSKLTRLRQVESEKNEVCLQPRISSLTLPYVAVVRNWKARQLPCAGCCVISPSASGWRQRCLRRMQNWKKERKRQQEQLRLFQSVVLNTKDAVHYRGWTNYWARSTVLYSTMPSPK